MNTPPAVAGCSKCGALFTPGFGDRGMCAACRRLAPAQPAARPSSPAPAARPAAPAATPGQPLGAFKRPTGPQRPKVPIGRRLRRIAFLAIPVLLVGGAALAIALGGGRTVSDAWSKARRQTLPQAWAAVQRHASDAWVAIRSHLPSDPPAPPRNPIRDSTASRTTRRHAPTPGHSMKGKALAKRSREDMNTPGSTP